jgi:hypothetical protein
MTEAISYHRAGLGRLDLRGPNRAVDPDYRWKDSFTTPLDGRLYGENSPWFAALISVPYGWFGPRGLMLIPALAALACTWLTCLLARAQLDEPTAVLAAVIVALASPVLVYGQVVWEHSLAVALCLGALALLPHRPVVAGLVCGLAAWLRTEELFFGLAVAAVLILDPEQRRVALGWLTGWAIAVAALLAVNTWLYGMPLGVHLAAVAGDRGDLSRLAWWHELWRRMVLPDGTLIYASLGVALVTRWAAGRWPAAWLDGLNALAILALTAGVVQAGTGSTTARSLPWILILLRPDLSGVPARPLRIALAFSGVLLLISPADAGDCWGPRFLLPAVPLMALVTAAALTGQGQERRRMTAVVVALLLLLSMASQARTVTILIQRRQVVANLESTLRDASAGCAAIVSDADVVPILCPTLYQDMPLLVMHDPAELATLFERVGGRPVLLALEQAAPWHNAATTLTAAGQLAEPALSLWRASPALRQTNE